MHGFICNAWRLFCSFIRPKQTQTMTNESNHSEKKLSVIQRNIAIAMAALLVTTSANKLPFMVSVSDDKLVSFKFLNDIFWFIGLLSLITSSLLIDSILDDEDIDFKQRLGLMGYGYLIFSVLVSVMSVAVTVLFIDLEMDQTKIPVLSIPFLPILLGVVGGIFY